MSTPRSVRVLFGVCLVLIVLTTLFNNYTTSEVLPLLYSFL